MNARWFECRRIRIFWAVYIELSKSIYSLLNTFERRRIMKQKKSSILFDFIMTIFTGGAWLIWVLIRYLRTH